ncbi:MAG TPA: hypothetical protein VFF52_31380 [Isosphaeraceae bacterium]|nr:hypothetical protein [Isosphaeraceae bacterium]
MKWFILKGQQISDLTALVMSAFTRPELKTELRNRLNLNLDHILNKGHYDQDVEYLVEKQNREGKIGDCSVITTGAGPCPG